MSRKPHLAMLPYRADRPLHIWPVSPYPARLYESFSREWWVHSYGMTTYTDDDLAEVLGDAAAHEHAAGWIGYLMQDKLQESLDGADVAQDYLPDLQSIQPHLDEYATMIDQMGHDAANYASADLARQYEQLIPSGSITPEYGLAVAGFLEREAERYARVALDVAEQTEKGRFYKSSIEAIGRDEQGEAQEIRRLLHGEFDWDDRNNVSFDDLTSVENVTDIRDSL